MVLAFLPAAFSGTCTAEMCKFRDSAAELDKMSARCWASRVDTFFALRAWRKAEEVERCRC